MCGLRIRVLQPSVGARGGTATLCGVPKPRVPADPSFVRTPLHRNIQRGLVFQKKYVRRRDVLKRILSPHLSNVDARSILDFGGGQGQLISDLIPGAVPYVYDISEAEPIAGVCKLKSLAECRSREYGLIICSNVLEHIAFPRNIMREIAGIASPSTLIYLEVPHEHPFRLRTKLRRLIDHLILLARRPRVATSLVGVGMLHVMHEHVNFFSHAALAELTSSSGLQIQASGTYSTEAEMLWTLASHDRLTAASSRVQV